ncbi:MAG: RNA polymerase sigma factor [Pseudonocardia sp.]
MSIERTDPAAAAEAVERTLTRLRRIDTRLDAVQAAPSGASAQVAAMVPAQGPGGRHAAAPAPGEPRDRPEAPEQRPRTLADLYAEHRMRLVRLAILLVDESATAEDVVQEAFTGLHRNWAGLRDEHAALAYLRTAVVNGSRSVLRRRRTARDYVPPHAVTARSAESLAMLSAEHQAVVDALAGLPPRQREVLVLRYYGGLSEAEIAEATGISRGAVKSTASRALASVADVLAAMTGSARRP